MLYAPLYLFYSFSPLYNLILSFINTEIRLDDVLASRMLQQISQSAEDQIATLIAQWTADVAYLHLWEGYLTAMEVGKRSEE